MNPVCANCGIEINWQPTIVDGRIYCCLGCSLGGPCSCDYSSLPKAGEFRALVCYTSVILLSSQDGRHELRAQEGGCEASDER